MFRLFSHLWKKVDLNRRCFTFYSIKLKCLKQTSAKPDLPFQPIQRCVWIKACHSAGGNWRFEADCLGGGGDSGCDLCLGTLRCSGNTFMIRTCEVSPAEALLAEKFVRLRFESAPVRPLVATSSSIVMSLLATQKRQSVAGVYIQLCMDLPYFRLWVAVVRKRMQVSQQCHCANQTHQQNFIKFL